MDKDLLDIIEKDKMGINIHLLDYINASIELGAKYRFITPPHHRIHTHAEVSNGTRKIRIINATPSINDTVASNIAKQKTIVNRLLQDISIRVPKQNTFHIDNDLVEIVNHIQYPVVVKPIALSRGKGVTAEINSTGQLKEAIEEARKAGSIHQEFIIIEEMIKGNNYRALVFDNLVIAASQKHLPKVIGNGTSTIFNLIEFINRTCRTIPRIAIDNNIVNTLAAQGYSPQSIPSVGKVVISFC